MWMSQRKYIYFIIIMFCKQVNYRVHARWAEGQLSESSAFLGIVIVIMRSVVHNI